MKILCIIFAWILQTYFIICAQITYVSRENCHFRICIEVHLIASFRFLLLHAKFSHFSQVPSAICNKKLRSSTLDQQTHFISTQTFSCSLVIVWTWRRWRLLDLDKFFVFLKEFQQEVYPAVLWTKKNIVSSFRFIAV